MYVYDSITEGRRPVCNYVFSSVRRIQVRRERASGDTGNKQNRFFISFLLIHIAHCHTLIHILPIFDKTL